jgi:DNA-binding transcriptional LysR family regulator
MATLENIIVFMRVYELGSFTAAARDLRMTAAAAGYRVQALERRLGCRLFNRTTRKLQPTEQGRAYYDSSLDIRDALERADARVAGGGGGPPGNLKVTAPLGLGRRVIAPLVPKFRLAHPGIDVRLRLSDYTVDLYTEAVDVAVRMAPLADSSLVVRKIADIERVLCAAPTYLARHGTPASAKALEQHQCLLLRFPAAQKHRWTLRQNGRAITVAVGGHIDADDGDVLTDWALAGEGIVVKPLFEVAAHLRSRALVRVLPDCVPPPVTLAVLHAYNRMVPKKVSVFADTIVDEVRRWLAHQADGTERGPRTRRTGTV